MPRKGVLPAPAQPAPPSRRYNLRSSTVSQEPPSEVQPADSSDPTVLESYLPISRQVWKFPGHIGKHARRIKELQGAWFAQGDKILGLDCDDVLVTDEVDKPVVDELDDSDTIVVATPSPSRLRKKAPKRSLPRRGK